MTRTRCGRREFLSTTAIAGYLLVHGGRMTFCRAEDASSDVNADNPFLKGNYAPVREEVTAERLPIVGKLPPELSGMYVRNGPNPQFAPLGRYHWFDGDGMLHGVLLRDGQASYRNRYLQTAGWHEALGGQSTLDRSGRAARYQQVPGG